MATREAYSDIDAVAMLIGGIKEFKEVDKILTNIHNDLYYCTRELEQRETACADIREALRFLVLDTDI